ncbi:hypothetical protein AMS68_003155 [Peltaster fructicola]|uniref:NAD(P)-binding domain-containing protein n=1 Tax=Peltaster fructicola TaxID=286661 RepID=A0A6H0XSP9_9PEZI|nr:hypothetical protein AMS68_003155 [Peltaster fructicola]
MPVHALLGATGSTGGAVLQYLLDEPLKDLELRVCVRSKPKLLKSFPDLEKTTSSKCHIYEANLDDTSSLQRCLKGAEIIYDCIASNDSAKGIHTAQDAANAVLDALRVLKKEQGAAFIKPVVLINRSVTLNEEAPQEWSKTIVHWTLYYCYDDIAKAVELFRSGSVNETLLELICVDPPALHAGTKRTGHKLQLTGTPFRSLNYPDLGAAFVEIAKRAEEFSGKGVMVGAAVPDQVEEHWDVLITYLLRGVRANLFGF